MFTLALFWRTINQLSLVSQRAVANSYSFAYSCLGHNDSPFKRKKRYERNKLHASKLLKLCSTDGSSKLKRKMYAKEVNDFKVWALRLGCPKNCLPSDSVLSRTMKSSDKQPVVETMNMIRSRMEVAAMRDNVLLESVSDLKSSTGTLLCSPQTKSIKIMEKSVEEKQRLIEEYKAVVNNKQIAICDKGKQVMELKQAVHENQAKCVQFDEKHNELTDKLTEETKLRTRIQSSTPIDSSTSKMDMAQAVKAIETSVKLLKHVYEAIGTRPLTQNDKSKLEEELHKTTYGANSFILLQAMKSYNNQQMKLVDKYINVNMKKSFKANNNAMSSLEIAIVKANFRIFRKHLENGNLKEERKKRLEQYVICYEQFLDTVINQMSIFNSNEVNPDGESLCREYLKEFIALCGNQALLELNESKIKDWQKIVSERDEQLKGGEVVISQLEVLYSEMEKKYNQIMDDITDLGVVNKKLHYLQELSAYTVNTAKNSMNIRKTSRYQLNTAHPTKGKYLDEILMLAGKSISQWNRTVPVNICMEITGQLSHTTISPIFPYLTSNAALKELHLKCAWYKVINDLSKAIEAGTVVPEFNDFVVSKNLTSETEKMNYIMKQMTEKVELNNRSLIEIEKYLKFLLNSSLGSFIPQSERINDCSYKEYEHEFLCACSIIAKYNKDGFTG